MPRFRVFLGAPPSVTSDHVWQTVREYPPATLDAASHRISLLYQNAISDDDDITPPPSLPSLSGTTTVQNTTAAPSASLPQTQETASSVDYSDTSSIAHFPNFQFNLHSVSSLSSLYTAAKSGRGSRKVNVLLAALEVQGPDTVRTKNGPDAGQEISILKLILGDDQGFVCKLTAWRDVADVWGGSGPFPGIKRGDVLYFENLVAAWQTSTTITLTASPYNKPSTQICYRTMPYSHQDNRLRPDLRLAQSDALVSRVAALVRWFENMAGLPGA